MLSLRMILILLGVLLVAGLYVWERRRRRETQQAYTDAPAETPLAAPPALSDGGPGLIVTLHIMEPEGRPLRGPDIMAAANKSGLVAGARRILHHMSADTPARAVFSVASMREPGSFDWERIDTFSTPGLVVFMCLPGPADALAMYEDMIDHARRLAHALEAEVYDERRSVLTLQTVEHTREQIRDFNRRLLLAQKQQGH
ncbi:MAG: cell division protein ZipA C-terminal FtsZ-binding domain-containing protein [Gammaproteobacteria bacterium]|nr:cell division protein ZipA C-terminal FtsZ-binding domain-containing protein [Gammaproteobacteria bacterium]